MDIKGVGSSLIQLIWLILDWLVRRMNRRYFDIGEYNSCTSVRRERINGFSLYGFSILVEMIFKHFSMKYVWFRIDLRKEIIDAFDWRSL